MVKQDRKTNKPHILVVDDESFFRDLLRDQLVAAGYAVTVAEDGQVGLQAALAQKPDLIILDVMMPHMDGFEVCTRVRQTPVIADVPVIFLTASISRENRQRAFDLGAHDFVMKPFEKAELLAQVTAVLTPHTTENKQRGQILAFFGAAADVGTTTLAIQMSRALSVQEGASVVLIDLDLPLGSIAVHLKLYHNPHVLDLLGLPADQLNIAGICPYAQQYRAGLQVIAAPGRYLLPGALPSIENLHILLNNLRAAGYQIVLDLGSNLNSVALAALRLADVAYVVTSGEAEANQQHNQFMAAATNMGLDAQRLMPVVNEIHGKSLAHLASKPLAYIAHANERARHYLWLWDQGVQTLLAALVR